MLNSLYEKAITKRGLVFNVESSANIENQLEGRWFDRTINKSKLEFSIGAGDGSFNKKKFLTANFCAVDAESVIYDGSGIKKIEDCDIFNIPHVSFLRELLSNYMAIYELKCALRTIKEYDVDYYLFDGSILGDLDNAYPRGAKQPSQISDNLNKNFIDDFQKEIEHHKYGFAFTSIRDRFDLSSEDEFKKIEEYNLYLASFEKLILLKELMKYRKKIISISKSSADNSIFRWNFPDIAFLDLFTRKQGLSFKKEHEVHKEATFPFFSEFFKSLNFTIFYLRLEDNKNVFKVELPYKASNEEIFRIIEMLKVFSVQGYPYLLNMAHNDVVIKDKNMDELLKIAKIYQKTNREML